MQQLRRGIRKPLRSYREGENIFSFSVVDGWKTLTAAYYDAVIR